MKKDRFPLYSLLFALHPVVFLYGYNTLSVVPGDIVRPLAILVVCWLVLSVAARLALGKWNKAGLWVSVSFFLVFSYGHILRIGRVFTKSDLRSVVAWLTIIILAGILVYLRRVPEVGPRPQRFLVLFGALLVLLPSLSVVRSLYVMYRPNGYCARWQKAVDDFVTQTNCVRRPAVRPDIYYIVLDEYARDDVLAVKFGYDNSSFTNELRDMGFFVANKSICNYIATNWSLATSLNMDYLGPLMQKVDFVTWKPPNQMIWYNRVALTLKRLGYKYVVITSDWSVTARSPFADIVFTTNTISELERLIIRKSILDAFWHPLPEREMTLWQFDKLVGVAKMREPTFTFVHIVCPHRPYVFGPTGGPPQSADERSLYVDQLSFVNKLVLRAVRKILKDSPTPPVIILQSDHGYKTDYTSRWAIRSESDINKPGMCDCLAQCIPILNAYYFPGARAADVYCGISPVNSFRVLLNTYFGAELKLVPDKTYLPNRYRTESDWRPERMRKYPP